MTGAGPDPGESDEMLVRAAVRGDEAAFARLVRRYLRRALAVAREYVATREDAEDAVQDTFARVYQALARFDARRPFSPWFYTILRRTALNVRARQRLRTHESLTPEHVSERPDPQEAAHRRELRARIEAALERLPRQQRACFRLCLVEGLSSGEAASALDLAESTVRVHVFKARQALQELLAEWRDEVEDH